MKYWMSILMIGWMSLAVGCSDVVDEESEPWSTPGESSENSVEGPEGPDYCAEFGWYDDGHCDEFCSRADPDCDDDPCGPEGCNGTSPEPPVTDPDPEPDPEPSPTDPDPEPDPEPTTCMDPDDPDVEYVGESPDECEVIFFGCEDGWDYFADDCGCGCVRLDEPAACLDDSDPGVSRMGDTEECTRIDFACVDGWEYFNDDCGCGCVIADPCASDADCENGYCQETACGTDAPCPEACVYPNCDDDSEVLCDALPPTCGPDEVAAVRGGCYECVDARTCDWVVDG